MEDVSSLEAVLRDLNEPRSLPILTLANPQRLVEGGYREQCAYRVAEVIQELETFRGAARIFFP